MNNEQPLDPSTAAEATGQTNQAAESQAAQAAITREDELQAEAAEMPDEDAVAAADVAAEVEASTKAEGEAEVAIAAESEPDTPVTKASLLARLRELATADDDADITTDELNRLKQQFYHLRNREIALSQEAWEADGNNPDEFMAGLDPDEDAFRTLMAAARERKAERRRAIDEQRSFNLERKRAIIAEMAAMSTDADNVNRQFPRFRDLQAEFTAIGEVPDTDATAVWKEYQDARERFYDQLKVNKELRDYDFKKNLADKQALIEEAAKLNDEPDVIAAFRRLQDCHERWRRIGPVAKELREEIWTRFKDASAAVNKRYQAHFEERKAREAENEQLKTAICERVEALDWSALQGFAAWDAMTREFLKAQEEWKAIGFASRRANNTLFARFRQRCDDFFAAKNANFKSIKDSQNEALKQKTALVQEAEALRDSTDWRATADRLAELQRQWRETGPVARKHSDALWKRFQSACSDFFDRKKEATSGVRRTEQANLKLKQEIIDRLAALAAPDAPAAEREEAAATIADLKSQWDEIGHVPFRLKDKLYDDYRDQLRRCEARYDLRPGRQRRDGSRPAQRPAAGDQGGNSDRRRLERLLETRKQELLTFENNIGFLSFKPAKGGSENPLVRDMKRRMESIRRDIDSIRERIAALDAAPAEKPAEAPAEKPAEAPAEKPAEAPAEKPAEAPEAPEAANND